MHDDLGEERIRASVRSAVRQGCRSRPQTVITEVGTRRLLPVEDMDLRLCEWTTTRLHGAGFRPVVIGFCSRVPSAESPLAAVFMVPQPREERLPQISHSTHSFSPISRGPSTLWTALSRSPWQNHLEDAGGALVREKICRLAGPSPKTDRCARSTVWALLAAVPVHVLVVKSAAFLPATCRWQRRQASNSEQSIKKHEDRCRPCKLNLRVYVSSWLWLTTENRHGVARTKACVKLSSPPTTYRCPPLSTSLAFVATVPERFSSHW